MKTILKRCIQYVLLTCLFLVFYCAGSLIISSQLPANPATQPGPIPAPYNILVIGAADTLVLMSIILTSRWQGWRLMLATGVVYYGCVTFMSQIETAYFLTSLTVSPSLLPRLFLIGIPPAFLFVPLAVWILGKTKNSPVESESNERLVMPASQWAWKLALVALVYLALYFSAGYFIAWQNPELRAFYHGSDAGNFGLHMFGLLHSDPWLFPFQIMRSLLWVTFCLPVIRMTRGNAWQTALLTGLLLAVPMNIVHLVANPLMPLSSVRMSHMIETSSSNFVFGLIIVWLLHRRHGSLADLFGIHPHNGQ
jgi:hypothetical protein